MANQGPQQGQLRDAEVVNGQEGREGRLDHATQLLAGGAVRGAPGRSASVAPFVARLEGVVTLAQC